MTTSPLHAMLCSPIRTGSYPDVLAVGDRVEDAAPSAARIKDGHVQCQHRVVPTPACAEPLSRLFLIHFCGVHKGPFNAPRQKRRATLPKLPGLDSGWRTRTPNPHCRYCEISCAWDYLPGLGRSPFIPNSTSTNVQNIEVKIMADASLTGCWRFSGGANA